MFTWPTLELTEYERRWVRTYKEGPYPGVLRRAYEVFFNTVADPLTPGLEAVKLQGSVQIARRSRVFGLSFAGNLGSWRLQIETASGEQMTPRSNDGYPIVSSMIAGSCWNALSALGDQVMIAQVNADGVQNSLFFGSSTEGPLLIDPNWELSPNETLRFIGTPFDNQLSAQYPPDPPAVAQKMLSIAVHVWEFPGMDGKSKEPGLKNKKAG
jgi:hypothetical protein